MHTYQQKSRKPLRNGEAGVWWSVVWLLGSTASVLGQPGTIDPSFACQREAPAQIRAIAWTGDGRILVEGELRSVRGVPRHGLACLDADGSVAPSFHCDLTGVVNALAVQADGKILVAGDLASADPPARVALVRLNRDGTRDGSFATNIVVEYTLQSIALTADGRIILGGHFGYVRSNEQWAWLSGIARLDPDGSLDRDFAPGTGIDGTVETVVVRQDGRIYAGGNFVAFNGVPRRHLVRVRPDGSLDPAFETYEGPDGPVEALSPL
jgi:uncharacterized delta-60 repeat protein